MAAPPSGASSPEAPTVEALIEALDPRASIRPEVRAAIADVDRTLITLALQQSPWERLRSASRMAQTLARLRDAMPAERVGEARGWMPRFVAAVQDGLSDLDAGGVVRDEDLGRRLDARFGALSKPTKKR